ncbi:MAG: GtrA family protein [Lentisphaerae bacterium]|jgi:putative flippase GtrA|nr:GtrA family protein [Lentisphaerota bacterium]
MSWQRNLNRYLSHEATPLVQFIKYSVAGGIATAVHIVAFFLAGFFLFPCVTAEDPLMKLLAALFGVSAPVVEEVLRARYAIYANTMAFIVSNVVCYIINRLFVFRPGRHHVIVEFLLFLAVSAISMVVGASLMGVLIKQFGLQTTYAFGANIFSSLAINYILRKFLVFKG